MEELKKQLKNQSLTLVDDEALKYSLKPVGKAIITKEPISEKQKEKTKWSDRVVCNICGVEFTRSARSNHNKTKMHNLHLSMHHKMKKLLLN
jgi:hypothetical protein